MTLNLWHSFYFEVLKEIEKKKFSNYFWKHKKLKNSAEDKTWGNHYKAEHACLLLSSILRAINQTVYMV